MEAETAPEPADRSIQPSPANSNSSANNVETTSSTKRSSNKKKRPVNDEQENIYEVERILDHKEHLGRITSYYVKWKDWPEESSTWEPLENLKTCLETVVEYFEKDIYPGVESPAFNARAIYMRESLESFSREELNEMAKHYFTESGDNIPPIDLDLLDFTIEALARIPPQAHEAKFVESVRTLLLLKMLKSERKKQIEILQHWERDVNSMCTDPAPVKVVNGVDLERPPGSFFFINKSKAGKGVEFSEEPPIGCQCSNSCLGVKCSCYELSGQTNYKEEGTVRIKRGIPIYECNKRCLCSETCRNRVLQKGRTIPLEIFRTSNGCGWGVRTLQPIEKGTFVVEYVGEIITTDEAERRGRYYDREGCTYLFDLDFNDPHNFPYTVDAAVYGNVSHFINHSCNPNLEVYAIWVDCLDPNLPRLGLFATRKINANEELNFDYLCQPPKDGSKRKGLPDLLCKCEARNCRKYLFF